MYSQSITRAAIAAFHRATIATAHRHNTEEQAVESKKQAEGGMRKGGKAEESEDDPPTASHLPPTGLGTQDWIDVVEEEMRGLLVADDAAVAPLYGMMRYHMGWATETFADDRVHGGKRLRPLVCLLCCAAAGGDSQVAVPAAAAIELLHNFTLVHDDIQDNSAYRRHRRTVWSLWGMAQGINVGDGMHAIANRALTRLRAHDVPPARVLDLMEAFDTTVLRICEGQYQDVDFERRWDITADDYLHMIGGKTAAIFAFAAYVGATLADAEPERTQAFDRFGTALGLGFQVRDDILGIWGDPDVTGKETADDIRRRKKSLPILMLHDRAPADERAYLESLYAGDEVPPDAVSTVLQLLADAGVHDACEEIVHRHHMDAMRLLAATEATGPARTALDRLVEQMAGREA
jgi:geranylgeranyl diphosphate synthase type I